MKAMKAMNPMKTMNPMKAMNPMTAMKAKKAMNPMKANEKTAMKAKKAMNPMTAMKAKKAMTAMKAKVGYAQVRKVSYGCAEHWTGLLIYGPYKGGLKKGKYHVLFDKGLGRHRGEGWLWRHEFVYI